MLFRTSYRKYILLKITEHSVIMVNSFKNYSPMANYSARRHEPPYLLDGNSKDRTTRGPTYSMTRAIGATPWRKGSSVDAIVCVATIAHSQWKSHSSHGPTSPIMATSMSMSARVQPQCRQSCKAHGVLDLCACIDNN